MIRSQVAVTMRKERLTGAAARWLDWRWKLHDVALDEGGFGEKPRLLHKGDDGAHWLFPAMTAQLFRDDAEGYYLNVTTEQPCFWVVWRMEEEPSMADEPLAVPHIVTVSYHDAGRWLDAQETVEQVPMSASVAQWVQNFVDQHHVLEAKRRQRPQSFKTLQDRFGKPARVSTDKNFGGGAPRG